ncbi:Aminomethyltransferase folate-binding domain-containing protein [Tuber magnatum]|uniref:Iron-sulfur cluster assembly factor IBA57 homolog, mitochondrial n=1 Tax=Tuber magnatum TaxID=42249 RepID=A0A317SR69_9PEZI|nr:Aminomethyltransferase folate-binding domain-containing protein [Tuber magnatum]
MPLRIQHISTPCLRRGYSSSTAPPQPPPLGISNISRSRQLIEIHGPDAAKYLQGVTTRNILKLTEGRGAYSAFLNAQGKVLYDVFIYSTNHNHRWRSQIESKNFQPKYHPTVKKGFPVDDPGFFIECDIRSADALLDHIRRYKLASKFDCRLIPKGEWDMWATWDDGRLLLPNPSDIGCTDIRAPNLGKRVAVYGGRSIGREVDVDVYNVRRMLYGVPEGQDEILNGGNIAQESNIDYMGGVDFRKGCYVGQELTIRTHHTGVVRKRVLPVQIYRPGDSVPERLTYDPSLDLAPPPGKNPYISSLDGKGRSPGKFLRGVGNVGLALCRLEAMTDFDVGGEKTDRTAPEFKLGVEGNELRVKAFVPGWHWWGKAIGQMSSERATRPIVRHVIDDNNEF